MKDTIIFDLDGTLADHSHRRHLLPTEKLDHTSSWHAFNKACSGDRVIEDTASFFRSLQDTTELALYIVTSRSDDAREETVKWLDDNGIYCDKLFMRANDDHRRDTDVKTDLLNKIGLDRILCCFDDNPAVIKHLRDLGLTVYDVVGNDPDSTRADLLNGKTADTPVPRTPNNKKTVLILNGPPGVGKDSIADGMGEHAIRSLLSFKKPMFDVAKAMLGPLWFAVFMGHYNNRKTKEERMPYLGNRSPREFFIWISEDVMKPAFGRDVFGCRASDAVVECNNSLIVFSDGGFEEEVLRICRDVDCHVRIARLHRAGFDFGSDSRSYIHIDPSTHGLNYPGSYAEKDFYLEDGDVDGAVQKILKWVPKK